MSDESTLVLYRDEYSLCEWVEMFSGVAWSQERGEKLVVCFGMGVQTEDVANLSEALRCNGEIAASQGHEIMVDYPRDEIAYDEYYEDDRGCTNCGWDVFIETDGTGDECARCGGTVPSREER